MRFKIVTAFLMSACTSLSFGQAVKMDSTAVVLDSIIEIVSVEQDSVLEKIIVSQPIE